MRLNPLGDGTPEVSPFQSIPASFWWCIVTLTTVGYGDETPYSGVGKFIAAVASLTGILVVAIPVSVISTNFNAEFLKLQRQRDQVRARMGLLRRHFREARTGLDAVLDEVGSIVKRNTVEFQGELEALFEQARDELTEELQEVLRMAYERRRQLHLAAIAAGQLQSAAALAHTSTLGGPGGAAGDGAAAGAHEGSSPDGGHSAEKGRGGAGGRAGSIADFGGSPALPGFEVPAAAATPSAGARRGSAAGGSAGVGVLPRFSGRVGGADVGFGAELAALTAPAPAAAAVAAPPASAAAAAPAPAARPGAAAPPPASAVTDPFDEWS